VVNSLFIFFTQSAFTSVYYFFTVVYGGDPDSSGSIVSGYGLDDRAIGVRSLAEAKDFSSNLCVQTDSGAHPASCTMGTRVLSPGIKRDRGVTLTTHPHLVFKKLVHAGYVFTSKEQDFHRSFGATEILDPRAGPGVGTLFMLEGRINLTVIK
jgi:hypothetical protein